MDDVSMARAIHVLAVVLWIGGVGMVTTVLLPAIRLFKAPEERGTFFEAVERRFATQARITTLLAGLSGFYMVYRLDLWDRFALRNYWWMHAMVCVWLVFTVMLFIIEPLSLHRKSRWGPAAANGSSLRAMGRVHWALLLASVITILGAVAGSHGLFLYD
jgi:uncharacterized membrane protein